MPFSIRRSSKVNLSSTMCRRDLVGIFPVMTFEGMGINVYQWVQALYWLYIFTDTEPFSECSGGRNTSSKFKKKRWEKGSVCQIAVVTKKRKNRGWGWRINWGGGWGVEMHLKVWSIWGKLSPHTQLFLPEFHLIFLSNSLFPFWMKKSWQRKNNPHVCLKRKRLFALLMVFCISLWDRWTLVAFQLPWQTTQWWEHFRPRPCPLSPAPSPGSSCPLHYAMEPIN